MDPRKIPAKNRPCSVCGRKNLEQALWAGTTYFCITCWSANHGKLADAAIAKHQETPAAAQEIPADD